MRDIRIVNISKAYGSRTLFSGFSAHIKAGESIALMGASGSGKTTLSRILLKLEKPDTGSVQMENDLKFSAVFQEDRLCEGISARANVALVLPKGHGVDIAAQLCAVGLSEETQLKEAGKLSGGEKRRVALVRAMKASGHAVLLDEAFKGLDVQSRAECYEYVKRNLAGRSLILITHDENEAQEFGARCIFVSAGEAVPSQDEDAK